MQLAGSFLEYFVSGTGAALWAWLLLPIVVRERLAQSPDLAKVAIILIPLLYVLGMLVDYVAEQIVSPFKKRIRAGQKADEAVVYVKSRRPKLYSKDAALAHFSEALAKDLTARSTRDRIARGAAFNLLLLAVLGGWNWISGRAELLGVSTPQFTVTVAIAGALSCGMWWRFQKLTYTFKYEALATMLLLNEQREVPTTPVGAAQRTVEADAAIHA